MTSASTGGLRVLRVSEDGRYLVAEDGQPFFWLGDTAWELFHRLDLEESERYLSDRAAKGFTVIQAVVLAEHDGLGTPNAYGEVPLVDRDPTKPNEAYFAHVDAVVDMAADKGLYVGMLPTWGDKWLKKWGTGPVVFDPDNAETYGEFLGRRYKDKPIVWILGGDRNPETEENLAVIRAMARGLARGDGGRHLMTFHPSGGAGSSRWFHGDDWLDINMIQSGHGRRNASNYDMIAADYARTPVKPCVDGEPCYENIPVGFNPANGWFDDFDVRKAAYWAVFAGAHGHTYGCNDIWQMYAPPRGGAIHARTPWQEALDLPGAGHMQHVKNLMLSRPFLTRIPDQDLLVPRTPGGAGPRYVVYSRNADGDARLYIDGRPEAVSPIPGTFANWDASFRLALANEFTGDRPWRGDLLLVALYDRPLADEDVQARFRAGPGAVPENPIALYTFAEGSGRTVHDVSGRDGPVDLEITDPDAVSWLPDGGLSVKAPVLIASAGPASRLAEAAAGSQALSIEAWVRPADYEQAGPARIVTLSRDTSRRNFTLGQDGEAFQVRLRTTERSDNGLPGLSAPDLEGGHVQATRDADGSYAMAYIPEAGQAVSLDAGKLSGDRLKAWWYDPRTGVATAIEGDFQAGSKLTFTAPDEGPDWVLVVDDASRGFGAPGTVDPPPL
jgi:hypothetical protein